MVSYLIIDYDNTTCCFAQNIHDISLRKESSLLIKLIK